MRDTLFAHLHVIYLRDGGGFLRCDAEHRGGDTRFQLKFTGEGRINGGDLCACVQQERVGAGVVDRHLDDIEVLRHVTRVYTGDVSGAMGRSIGGWRQQEKTCQSRPLDIEHWRSPRPWWRLGELWARGSARS